MMLSIFNNYYKYYNNKDIDSGEGFSKYQIVKEILMVKRFKLFFQSF